MLQPSLRTLWVPLQRSPQPVKPDYRDILIILLLIFQYEALVAENKADVQIMEMTVTDGDKPHSPAWNAKFKIISGDPEGLFSVKTGPNKQEGILSTAKVNLSHN